VPEDTRRVFQVVINAPIEAVWREITRTDAPIAAFFNSRMHLGPGGLKPGSKLAMRTPDARHTGVVGTILEIDPPRRFSHTFRFTTMNDPECKVTYELKPIPGSGSSGGSGGAATEFTLIIDDLPVGTKTAKQMIQGGTLITSTLKSVMETGRPSFGVRMLFVLFKIMPPPKAARSENWPV
jgi:uncharacterized protein YndB with AHSA1/START domain